MGNNHCRRTTFQKGASLIAFRNPHICITSYMLGSKNHRWEIEFPRKKLKERPSPKNSQVEFFRGQHPINPYALKIMNMYANGVSVTSLSAQFIPESR